MLTRCSEDTAHYYRLPAPRLAYSTTKATATAAAASALYLEWLPARHRSHTNASSDNRTAAFHRLWAARPAATLLLQVVRRLEMLTAGEDPLPPGRGNPRWDARPMRRADRALVLGEVSAGLCQATGRAPGV